MSYVDPAGVSILSFDILYQLEEVIDVTINAYTGLLLCPTHIHNIQLHMVRWYTSKFCSLTFHKIYEIWMKNNNIEIFKKETYKTKEPSITCSHIWHVGI